MLRSVFTRLTWVLGCVTLACAVSLIADAQELEAPAPNADDAPSVEETPAESESAPPAQTDEEDPSEPAATEDMAEEGLASETDDGESMSDEPADTGAPDDEANEPASSIDDSDEENPGQADFDQAMEVKIGAETLNDLNEVVDLIDSALEKGLDAENADFAEKVLVATLMQRATGLAAALLRQPTADPRQNPRLLQIRLFALTDLQRAVSLDENQTEAWLMIGRLQSLVGGNPSEARRALTKVIRLAEKNATNPKIGPMDADKLAQVHALRGATQKDQAARLEDFDRAVELAPTKLEFRLLRAKQLQAIGRPEDCLEDIEQALALAPDNAAVHELKALSLLMLERYDEALESFDKTTELAPEAVSPYQYRAEMYGRQEKNEEAIAELDKALELEPENLAALLKRAELLSVTDQFERALADVETAMRLRPDLALPYLLKAQLLEELGRQDEADASVQQLADAARDQLEIQLQIAGYYAGRERPLQAIPTLDNILEKAPENPEALSLRGNMYLLIGEHAEALEDFAAAVNQRSDDSSVLNNYAWTLATTPTDDLRDGQKAIELATKACELTEYEDPVMLSTLAASYAEIGDFEEAVRWSEQAVDKATVAGSLANFDGQLVAELESYQRGEPWRERQQVGVDGEAVTDPELPLPPPREPNPLPHSRSLDF